MHSLLQHPQLQLEHFQINTVVFYGEQQTDVNIPCRFWKQVSIASERELLHAKKPLTNK